MADHKQQEEPLRSSNPMQQEEPSAPSDSLQQEPSVIPSDQQQVEEPSVVLSTPTDRLTPVKVTELGSTSSDENARKIFVGGLPHRITREEIIDYFSTYGTIFDAIIVSDQSTGKARGFGFVTFDSEEAVNRALHKCYHDIKGKQVETKKAIPKKRVLNGTTSNNNYNRQSFSNFGHHHDPIYQNCYSQYQNWMIDDGCTGYVCPNCGHNGYVYSNYYDIYKYAGDYGWYNGWVGDQLMNGNGYHHNYGSYVQSQGPLARPNGNFVSTNGYVSPIMANSYDYGLQNVITRRASVASSVDPPEFVAGVGEPEANGFVPALTESTIAVNGATGEQQTTF